MYIYIDCEEAETPQLRAKLGQFFGLVFGFWFFSCLAAVFVFDVLTIIC